ncbi:GPI-anchor transamidase component PIGT [Petromyzon marinus]|uniref:GPI-anchor transamidase component PIGT n=1 Tax=Petromyzon marinus TaxID=7757 RepID=UPI003F6FF3D4
MAPVCCRSYRAAASRSGSLRSPSTQRLPLLLLLPALLLLLLLPASNALGAGEDTTREQLLLKPLSPGLVSALFHVETRAARGSAREQHYRLFPRPLGSVLSRYWVRELHLSLTVGAWRGDSWGTSPAPAPHGAQLWVWFQNDVPDVDAAWQDLVNVLSGMFCASLNFIDASNTASPEVSFRPSGPANITQRRLLRYAALPREVVCTENLTPWKKLLPCGSKAGLATLLNGGKLYNSNFHSLAVHVQPTPTDPHCNGECWELTQSLLVVFDVFPAKNRKPDWSLSSLFGRGLTEPCPLASNSTLVLDLTRLSTAEGKFHVSPLPPGVKAEDPRGAGVLVYDLKDPATFAASSRVNVALKWSAPPVWGGGEGQVVHVERFLTGYGLQTGGIATLVHNTHSSQGVTALLMLTVPWYLRLYVHTLSVSTRGRDVVPSYVGYVPAQGRRPHLLELLLQLPPRSTTRVTLSFERALLTWTDYPPDPNHGFYIASAVVTAMMPIDVSAGEQSSVSLIEGSGGLEHSYRPLSLERGVSRVYTPPLLISLPTPDFSMPYNVICLTCTVLAVGFGSLHNLLTRRFTVAQPAPASRLVTCLANILRRMRGVPPLQ